MESCSLLIKIVKSTLVLAKAHKEQLKVEMDEENSVGELSLGIVVFLDAIKILSVNW